HATLTNDDKDRSLPGFRTLRELRTKAKEAIDKYKDIEKELTEKIEKLAEEHKEEGLERAPLVLSHFIFQTNREKLEYWVYRWAALQEFLELAEEGIVGSWKELRTRAPSVYLPREYTDKQKAYLEAAYDLIGNESFNGE